MLGSRTDSELRGMALVGEAKENDGVLGLRDLPMELLGTIQTISDVMIGRKRGAWIKTGSPTR